MIKLYLLLVLFTVKAYSGSIGKTNYLIESSLNHNFDQICKLSDSLTDDERYKLYEAQKVKAFWPFLINAFLIPGAGSALQKDFIPATAASLAYFGGFGLLAYRSSLSAPGTAYDYGPYTAQGPSPEALKRFNDAHDTYIFKRKVTLVSGVVLMGSSWVFGLIRPFIYSSNYNNKLGEALKFTGKMSLYLLPDLNEDYSKLIITLKF